MAAIKKIDLTALEAALVVRLAKDLEPLAREVQPGKSQQASLLLALDGVLSKGEAGGFTRVQAPAAADIAAWFLSRMTAEARARLLDEFAAQAKTAGGIKVDDEHARAQASLMIQLAGKTVIGERTGSLTGVVQVSAVDATKLTTQTKAKLSQVSRRIDLSDEPAATKE